ncbi:MAG: FAD-dependent oxidoreductase, partial [Bacteroidales bacterium]|nr:FAD-dependent oxidoreductase [Bacteroidales bacterium]
LEHFTSCMLCLVKDNGNGKLFPSCSVQAAEDMEVVTDDDEIAEARQTALELLLSEHVGDCEAPCHIACPAHMNIPLMNRLIAAGKFNESLEVVKRDIALPAVLGRICPAPCEGACHRKTVDEPVSICLLKRFVGDEGAEPEIIPAKKTGHKVAVIGAGPAGLAAAYYLQLRGIQVSLFDKAEKAGGQLRTEISEEILPRNSYQTSVENVFAIGNALRSSKLAVRSVGQGKEVAFSIWQYLSGQPVKGEPRMFNSRFGRLVNEEYSEYLKESVVAKRVYPEKGGHNGFSAEEAIAEAKRCLRCDCRAMDDCKLRIYSDQYSTDQRRFKTSERRKITKLNMHSTLIYEPQKCIKCGICVRLTEKYGERFGFTYIGRGFDVEVGVPFNEELEKALTETALKVAKGCPTGAIELKDSKK